MDPNACIKMAIRSTSRKEWRDNMSAYAEWRLRGGFPADDTYLDQAVERYYELTPQRVPTAPNQNT